MKQQVRVGVLASLLMAPAVLASANEQVNQENINPEEVVEQVAVVHPLTVNPTSDEGTAAPQEIEETNEEVIEEVIEASASKTPIAKVASTQPVVVEAPATQVSNVAGTQSTLAATDVEELRIKELKNLGESTIIYQFSEYRKWIDEISSNLLTNEQKTFLKAKVNYLEKFSEINKRAQVINEELKLLKPTNPNTLEVMEGLELKLKSIETEYKKLRIEFEGAYNTFHAIDDEFAEASIKSLPSFIDTTESFLKINLPGYSTYEKFAKDILKPKQLITATQINNSSAGTTSTDTAQLVPAEKLNLYKDFEVIENSQSYGGTYPDDIKNAYQSLVDYYTTEFSATEKQIFESYKRTDGRTIKEVLDTLKKDFDAAAKVEEAIQDIESGINGLTAAQFNSKMKSMIAAYDKLTDRQQAMATSYALLVEPTTRAGMLSAYNVSSAIAALKASNKDEYRVALYKANDMLSNLNDAHESGKLIKDIYVKNQDVLTNLIKDFEVAVGPIADLQSDGTIEHTATSTSVEGLIQNIDTQPTTTTIEAVRAAYNKLTASQKKLVNNYKELQTWEKFSKSSISLIAQINKIKIEDSKAFASAVQKADKALEKLTDEQKKLVVNLERLNYLRGYADAVAKMNALKLSNKDEYREAVGNPATDLIEEVKGNLAVAINVLDKDLAVPSPDNDPFKIYAEKYSDLLEKDRAALAALKETLEKKIKAKQNEVANAKDVEQLIIIADAKPDTASSETEVDKLKAIQEARAAYDKLSANEKKIVNNLKTLTAMEKVAGQPLKVIAAINAVDPEASNFASKAKSALNAYDKLSSTLKSYIDQERKNKVENFKRYLAVADLVKALKSTSPSFESEVKKVREQLNKLIVAKDWAEVKEEGYVDKLVEAVKLLEPKVKALEEAQETANKLDAEIDSLAVTFDYNQFTTLAESIQSKYNQLSADGKKLVTKYKQFQQLKKDSTAAHKVIQQINNRTIYMEDVANAGYEKAIANALKAYEKLTPSQKRYVYNYASVLEPQLRIYEVVGMINKLKPTSKTYLDDLTSIRLAYNALSEEDKKKLAPIYYKITNGEVGVEEVRKVIDLINEATPEADDYVKKLQAARAAYDNLASISPSYQKLVTNYKLLQDREKALKPVMTSVYQIQELQELIVRPLNDAKIFVSKYNAAVKGYEKVPYESRPLVHNRHVLLTEIYPVASTMEAILKIKANSKTFAADVRKAREWYDGLSSTDQGLVTNYPDLIAYEQIISGGSEVDQLIAAIPRTPISGYMQAIKDARAAYNALLPDEKKAVSLYKELQNYEKGVKNVLAAIDAIDNLQNSSNLVSAYNKAQKALDKLTSEERQMVTNMNKLQSVGPAMEVYNQINSLKPSQDNYAGAVQAVYAAYNRLSSIEKQYVTNFAQLQEAKNNVDNLAAVIAKITTITPGSRDYANQVQEALALYNTLPAAMKKMVPNIEMLNQSQKELTAAQKVRSMISEIDVNSANFVQKTLAARTAYDKLTTNEKRLVSNYFLLEDFEYQLGNMF